MFSSIFNSPFDLDNPPIEPLMAQSLKECRQRGQNYNESRELVMRWMQLATFLPVIRYARLPSDCDPQVLQLTKNLTSLRQQTVSQSHLQQFQLRFIIIKCILFFQLYFIWQLIIRPLCSCFNYDFYSYFYCYLRHLITYMCYKTGREH